MTARALEELAEILRRRIQIIGDLELRENDPTEHLRRLQEVSLEITEKHQTMAAGGQLQPRLAHFLENSSFQKALDWIEYQLRKMK